MSKISLVDVPDHNLIDVAKDLLPHTREYLTTIGKDFDTDHGTILFGANLFLAIDIAMQLELDKIDGGAMDKIIAIQRIYNRMEGLLRTVMDVQFARLEKQLHEELSESSDDR